MVRYKFSVEKEIMCEICIGGKIIWSPTGIISHGGVSDWALMSYKAMANKTIANALDTTQCKTIPYNFEWNTGISRIGFIL